MPHYTARDDKSFLNRIVFDFVAQIEEKLATTGTNQSQLANKLGVTESAVSQVLGLVRRNPNLKTMVQYATALGMKVAVVMYDDGDPSNNNGPIGPEIFSKCWEELGKPKDIWSVGENLQMAAANYANEICFVPVWNQGWANSTHQFMFGKPNTSQQLPLSPVKEIAHAGSQELHI